MSLAILSSGGVLRVHICQRNNSSKKKVKVLEKPLSENCFQRGDSKKKQ